ncbi:hypothetical protein CDL15_Pgr019374 [Punica granatum]|uniref:Uncharacterized protein n=1 Tax=Punica granatum TaxID=22663 RepID=A0A218XTB8_PUNGR|nr:hypothetical protein CDL15_Pgr019374 [Punica granatum]PKI61533.1 hypothetical protein CRG98_018080 [Punica granatum]
MEMFQMMSRLRELSHLNSPIYACDVLPNTYMKTAGKPVLWCQDGLQASLENKGHGPRKVREDESRLVAAEEDEFWPESLDSRNAFLMVDLNYRQPKKESVGLET